MTTLWTIPRISDTLSSSLANNHHLHTQSPAHLPTYAQTLALFYQNTYSLRPLRMPTRQPDACQIKRQIGTTINASRRALNCYFKKRREGRRRAEQH